MIRSKFFRTVMIAVVTLMAVSCSDNKPELLKQVPADTDLVALIDAQAILESAGFVAGAGSLQCRSM